MIIKTCSFSSSVVSTFCIECGFTAKLCDQAKSVDLILGQMFWKFSEVSAVCPPTTDPEVPVGLTTTDETTISEPGPLQGTVVESSPRHLARNFIHCHIHLRV